LGSATVNGTSVAVNITLPPLEFSTVLTTLLVTVVDSGTYLAANDTATSPARYLPIAAIRINTSVTVEENGACAMGGCLHAGFASDISSLQSNGRQVEYSVAKLSGDSVDTIALATDGTLEIHAVWDRVGWSYFRVTLEANGSLPFSHVDRVIAVNVSYVNQPPRFTLNTNGSALLVSEQAPVPLLDDPAFDSVSI
jgi:hypothetical protein